MCVLITNSISCLCLHVCMHYVLLLLCTVVPAFVAVCVCVCICVCMLNVHMC